MRNKASTLFLICVCSFAVIVPIGRAHFNTLFEWDDVWQKRSDEAKRNILEAYHPQPENITNDLAKAVHEHLKSSLVLGSNSTRRELGKRYRGPCLATNPIDQCWRCDPNWANNRKRLADCAMGFGRNAKGGKDGEFYEIKDSSDDLEHPKPGTLRYAVIQKRPLWITFKHDMVIRLKGELLSVSDKTIDGRGARVFITGGSGITLQSANNVIIHGVHITKITTGQGGLIMDMEDHLGKRDVSDGDGITISESSNVWIDHVSMKQCADGLIDVVRGSTGITISNSHFTDHNTAMLFGHSDDHTPDVKMQITVAFNHFGKRMIQRMPRARFGYFHIINNDYTQWEMYAIGGSKNPTIISQGNRYVAPNDHTKKKVTKRDPRSNDWKQWTWRSEGDLFLNGAYFIESGDPDWSKKHPDINDGIPAAPGSQVGYLTKFSGVIECKVGKPC